MGPSSVLVCMAIIAGAGPMQQESDSMAEWPDPLVFDNGDAVTTPAEWERRREEMLDTLLAIQYGVTPDDAGPVSAVAQTSDALSADGTVRRRDVTLAWGPDGAVRQTLHLSVPSEGDGPWPVILRIGLEEPAPGEAARRGLIFAAFDHAELDPHHDGKSQPGPVQAAYPGCSWGSIAVWAWGASRALDYLLTLPEVDGERTVITGHSRAGKAALLAGAMDPRFAVAAPNGSGCGGAALYRVYGDRAETLEIITRPERFAAWFHADFRAYAGHEPDLPFDQHFLRALVAPRAVISLDSVDDHWANPLGAQAAFEAARPVFDFLGAPHHNALHFRTGPHAFHETDYRALLDFAEGHFAGAVPEKRFRALPFPAFRPGDDEDAAVEDGASSN